MLFYMLHNRGETATPLKVLIYWEKVGGAARI